MEMCIVSIEFEGGQWVSPCVGVCVRVCVCVCVGVCVFKETLAMLVRERVCNAHNAHARTHIYADEQNMHLRHTGHERGTASQ